MNRTTQGQGRILPSAAALCRISPATLAGLLQPEGTSRLCAASAIFIIAGTTAYGFAFGLWRCGLQACYSAVKMPLLFFAIVLTSTVINFMLARLLGATLTFRQVLTAVLMGMAVTAIVLGSLTPVVLFIVLQVPSPPAIPPAADRTLMPAYWMVLLLHVAMVAVAGLIGNLKLFALLTQLTGRKLVAARVLVAWVLIIGLVGCELSWIVSPFLARPDIPVPFFNPNALTGNFFEYVWRALGEVIREGHRAH